MKYHSAIKAVNYSYKETMGKSQNNYAELQKSDRKIRDS